MGNSINNDSAEQFVSVQSKSNSHYCECGLESVTQRNLFSAKALRLNRQSPRAWPTLAPLVWLSWY